MKYDQVKELSAKKFRRLTGVQATTFEKMAEILRGGHGLDVFGGKVTP